MRSRTMARKFALQILYQVEITKEPIDTVLRKFWNMTDFEPKTREFADLLVYGVVEHLQKLDQSIEKFSKNWEIHRMPVVDLCIMRIAAYELSCLNDIPCAVSINEAVELAKEFSTDKSAKFINGVLDKLKEGCQRWLGR